MICACTGEVMNTSVPIIFTVFPRDDGSLNRRLVTALRIPSSFQISPPAPTDSSTRIEERPGMTVYALYVTVKPCSHQQENYNCKANQSTANRHTANQSAANRRAANQSAANKHTANQSAANRRAANQSAANRHTCQSDR